jgi:hypothetical protein
MANYTYKDLTGKIFGSWRVIKRTEKPSNISINNGEAFWLCECKCGKIAVLSSGSFCANKKNGSKHRSLQCKSCSAKKRGTIHGYTLAQFGARLLAKRNDMIRRCYKENDKAYHNYGGRGITVCDEWLNSYQKFYEWCIASGFQEGLTLDRIDNDKGYSPENCRWVTKKEQARNRRNNVMLTYNDKTMCLADWATTLKVSRECLARRLKSGWTVDKIMTTPKRVKNEQL